MKKVIVVKLHTSIVPEQLQKHPTVKAMQDAFDKLHGPDQVVVVAVHSNTNVEIIPE